MPLTQEERINLSKTIITIPEQLSELDNSLQAVMSAQSVLLGKDNFIKSLTPKWGTLISTYHDELKYINGQDRINVTESDIQNSAKRVSGNPFFPSDPNFPTPSVTSGVWKFYTPFLLSYGVGKNKSESYTMIPNYEKGLINSIITAINTFNTTYTAIRRTTGQGCVIGVPPATDTISTDSNIATAMVNLVNLANSLLTVLNSEKSSMNSNLDSDSTRSADKNNNISSVDICIASINTWLSYPDFNTGHGQTSCTGFNSYNASLLAPTKGFNTQINALKASLETRLSYCTIRENQILSYLGSVEQDTSSTGDVSSYSGFYGERDRIINLRINILGGSLSSYLASLNSSNAINQQKKTIQNAQEVYSSILKTSKLKAPSNGTSFVHVADASAFTVGQTVYLMANTQQEITLTIEQISGTMIKVNKNIPPTYRPTDGARLYVDLS